MATPKTLGKFDILKTLGKGGMGTVYLGYDKKLHRHVAIKTIRHEEPADDELLTEYARRFELEAKAIAKLNHPNIVSVYDSGEEGDTAYLVMEFVEGRDLKYYFDKKIKFTLAEALRLTIDLLEALAHAHDNGVWHRDIKPANVMINAKGQIKLTDFGVSRITDNTERSRVGTMVGTLHYMSPEQVLNTGVTHLSDTFAAAVILYEFLTQTRPFSGSDFEISNKIVRDEATPPSQINPGIPPRLDAILAKAMSKQPNQRYPSARDFAVDLKLAISELKEEVVDHDATMCFYASHGSKNTIDPLSRRDNRSRTGNTIRVTNGSSNIAAPPPSGNADIEFWRSIKDSTDRDELGMYLSLFPHGTYESLARKRMEKLDSAKPPTAPSLSPTAAKNEHSLGELQDEDIAADAGARLTRNPTNEKKRPARFFPAIFLSAIGLAATGFWVNSNIEKNITASIVMPNEAITPPSTVLSMATPVASAPINGVDAPKKTTIVLSPEMQRSKEPKQFEKMRHEEVVSTESKKDALTQATVGKETVSEIHNCLLSVSMSAGESNKTDTESCTIAKAKVDAWIEQWKSPTGTSKGWDKYHGQDIGECKCQAGSCTVEIRFLNQQASVCD